MVLPYVGSKGDKLIKSNKLKCVLPENDITRVTYSGTRLSSEFTKVIDKIVKEHQHDIAYCVKCSENQCSEDINGETAQGLPERVRDHNGINDKSHLVKHAIEKSHKYLKIEVLNIIGKSDRNNTFKRKVADSLSIKDYKTNFKHTR